VWSLRVGTLLSMRRAAAGALWIALVAVVACSSEDDRVRDRPRPERSAPPVTTGSPEVADRVVEVGGRQRTYRLYVPGSLDRSRPAPLVVVLHGGFGTGTGAVRVGKWDREAEDRGFLTAAPDGVGRTWNAGICCGPAQRDGVDDVAFVVALVDDVAAEYDLDRRRVYATGLSNGGLMAYRLACDAADRFAAVAPLAATLPIECRPGSPVSLLHIHGLADENIPFVGGAGEKGVVAIDWPPARDGVERWVEIDGCAGDPTVNEGGGVTTESWAVCDDGTAVELVTIAGGGHSWPGGRRLPAPFDPPSNAFDATPAIWDFFAAHPKR
jgi:polyhydroxybutyrate depolymerase